MFCPRCGKNNADNSKFCMNCGLSLTAKPEEAKSGAKPASYAYEAPRSPDTQQYFVPVMAPVQYYQPKQQSRSSRMLSAIGKSLCYLGAFAGIQGLVIVAWMFPSLIRAATSGTLDSPDAIYHALSGVFGEIHEAMIVSAVISVAFLWLFFLLRRKKFIREIYLRPLRREPGEGAASAFAKWIPAIIAFGIAAQFAVSIAMNYLVPESMMDDFTEAQSLLASGAVWLQILDIAIFTPVIEEIFFRGLIFSRLRRVMPFWWAASISSVIFGAMHGHVVSLIYATLLGLAMALLFEHTGTLLAPIIFHFAFNLTSFIPIPDDDMALLFIMCASALACVCLGAYLFAFTPKSENVFIADKKVAPAQQYVPYQYIPVYADPYAPTLNDGRVQQAEFGANNAPAAPDGDEKAAPPDKNDDNNPDKTPEE